MSAAEKLPLLADEPRPELKENFTYLQRSCDSNDSIDGHYINPPENENISGSMFVWAGFALVAFSALCFALALTTSRYLQVQGLLTSPQVGYLICAPLLLFSSTYIAIERLGHKVSFNFSQKTLLWLAIRGIMGTVTIIFLTKSMRYIPMGDSDAIFYISPAITILLSRPLLGEPTVPIDIISALCGFAGAIIVACPNSQDQMTTISQADRMTGSALAFGAALSNAIVMVAVRAIVCRTHFMLSIWSLAFFGTVVTASIGGIIPIDSLLHNIFLTFLCLVVSISIFVAQLAYNYGFRLCSASSGSVFRILEIPLSYLLSLFILDDPVSYIRLFGASVVLVGSVLSPVRKLLEMSKVRRPHEYV